MSGFPVVITDAGGAPFVAVENGAPQASTAAQGIAVTLVESGAPALVIEGLVHFNLTETLPADVEFARASQGTYYDVTGALISATTDAPRFDHDPVSHNAIGLLIEPVGQNEIAYSEAFNNPYWLLASVTVTADVAVAPDGSTTADLLAPSATNGLVYRNLTADAATDYVFSVWLKSATGSPVSVQLAYNGGGANPNPKTQTITVTTSWQRFQLPMTTTAGGTINVIIGGYDAVWTPGGNLHAWGAQLEASPAATSYMPSSGGVGTRAPDELSFTVPDTVSALRFTFDDGSTQDIAVAPGAFTVPTDLAHAHITRIRSL